MRVGAAALEAGAAVEAVGAGVGAAAGDAPVLAWVAEGF
jgi:hypothetical protein